MSLKIPQNGPQHADGCRSIMRIVFPHAIDGGYEQVCQLYWLEVFFEDLQERCMREKEV